MDEKKNYSGLRKKTMPMMISCSMIFLLVGMALASPPFMRLTLDNIIDCNVPTPDDNDVLTYDTATANWTAQAPTGGVSELWDRSDTTLYTYNDGDDVTVNGTIATADEGSSTVWNDAYTWGDHSLMGYLTDWNDGDPFYNNSDTFHVTSVLMSEWNESYAWGDHSLMGYLTEGGEDFWSRADTTLYTAIDNDNVQVNATLIVDKINLRNETKSWDIYTNETGVIIWEWV